MIHTVRIRRFKRFGEVEFRLPGHVVLAGPNNTGKTTVSPGYCIVGTRTGPRLARE